MHEETTDRVSATQQQKLQGLALFYAHSSSSRVPSLSPRETVQGHVASFPAVCRWETLLPRQGGGRTIEAFDDTFFDWWA
jgi:hypothetical protein